MSRHREQYIIAERGDFLERHRGPRPNWKPSRPRRGRVLPFQDQLVFKLHEPLTPANAIVLAVLAEFLASTREGGIDG